ncbi:MAG: hypothetical protein ACI9JN_000080 [Bacteroidia bacterium]|jgi:hypothetical protein
MSVLAPSQKPAIEGNIDRALFAGQVIEQEPFYKAFKVRDNTAFLYGGKLHGIFDNASIAAYPIGTTSIKGKSPIAAGKVIVSEGTWCKVEFEKDLDGSLDDYWFFITEHSFGEITICLRIDIWDKAQNAGVAAAISNSP